MNSFYFDKMHMLYNQNKSCVKSCKNIALKNKHCFPKKPIVLPKNPLFSNMCTFFIPLFWNEKLSLALYLNLLTKFLVWFEIISSIVKLNQNFAELLRKRMVLLKGD